MLCYPQGAQGLGIAAGAKLDAAGLLAAVRKHVQNADWWREQLDAMPELCVLALEALAEAGGLLENVEAIEQVAARSGFIPAEVEKAFLHLAGRGLTALLNGGNPDAEAFALWQGFPLD